MPQGGVAHFYPQVVENPLSKLGQGQILLLANPSSQAPIMAFQATAAITAALPGFKFSSPLILAPVSFHAGLGDSEQQHHLRSAVPLFSRRYDPLTQITTVGLHSPTIPSIASD